MKTDSGPASLSAPVTATSRNDQVMVWRDDGGPRWFTIAQTSRRLGRHQRSVLNWLSLYPQLPRRTGTVVYRRLKRKAIYLRGDAVHWLTEVVIFKNAWARRNPPSR
jgi:hypothetical protein